MKNAAGQKQSQTTHKGIRVGHCSDVFRIAENDREAYRARTKAEFIAKCGDSLRELEETAYWFELLVDGKIVPAETLADLRRECDELIAIFVTILKRSKETS
jgi:four helix bundle protein